MPFTFNPLFMVRHLKNLWDLMIKHQYQKHVHMSIVNPQYGKIKWMQGTLDVSAEVISAEMGEIKKEMMKHVTLEVFGKKISWQKSIDAYYQFLADIGRRYFGYTGGSNDTKVMNETSYAGWNTTGNTSIESGTL
jgi:hypothetical protein